MHQLQINVRVSGPVSPQEMINIYNKLHKDVDNYVFSLPLQIPNSLDTRLGSAVGLLVASPEQ